MNRLIRSRRPAAILVLALVVPAAVAAVASGRAAGSAFPGAPGSQRFPQFGRCPIAAPSRYLPRHSGCVSMRRADVDGDGRTDLIVLYGHLNAKQIATGFTLEVVRAQGEIIRIAVPRSELNATIARLRNVNGRPGVEIFVHDAHITTEEVMGIYSFDGHRLRRAGGLPYDGQEAGIRFGFTCHTTQPASIVEHRFEERTPFKGTWKRTDTSYRWVGARLVVGASHESQARPTPAEVGMHC